MQVNVNAGFMLTQTLLQCWTSPSSVSRFTSSGVVAQVARIGVAMRSQSLTEGLMQVLADELGATGNIKVNSLSQGR